MSVHTLNGEQYPGVRLGLTLFTHMKILAVQYYKVAINATPKC